METVMDKSEQQPENPYIFRNRSIPNGGIAVQEAARLSNLICVGDLVQIGANGLSDPNAIPTWHRSYVGEVGVIVNFSKDGNNTYEILLGNGTLLERVYLLDFVMVQPAARK